MNNTLSMEALVVVAAVTEAMAEVQKLVAEEALAVVAMALMAETVTQVVRAVLVAEVATGVKVVMVVTPVTQEVAQAVEVVMA